MPEEFKFGLRLTIDNKDLTVGVGLAEKDIKRLARVIKEAAGPTGRTTRAIRKYGEAVKRTGRSFLEAHGHHLKYITAIGASAALTANRGRRRPCFRPSWPAARKNCNDSGT